MVPFSPALVGNFHSALDTWRSHHFGTVVRNGIIGLYFPPHRHVFARKISIVRGRSSGRTKNAIRTGLRRTCALIWDILVLPPKAKPSPGRHYANCLDSFCRTKSSASMGARNTECGFQFRG